jgi:pantothenate kinase
VGVRRSAAPGAHRGRDGLGARLRARPGAAAGRAVAIEPDSELVVTEGNYLLLDRPEWRAVRAELDEVWFLDVPDEVRRPRLLARHTSYGKTPAEAEAWTTRVDDANAALVTATRAAADLVVDGTEPGGPRG